MESLTSPPWGLPPPAYTLQHHHQLQQTRNRFGSALNLRETCPPTAQQNLLPRRQRSPSLPPISSFQVTPKGQQHRFDEVEGETSGYASDSVPQSSPEYWQNGGKSSGIGAKGVPVDLHPPVAAWRHRHQEEERIRRWTEGAAVSTTTEEQRPRWGDRGVAAGRLWEPHEAGARLPQVTSKGTPTWVERSLNMIDNGDSQIFVVDQRSVHSSDVSEYKAMSEQHEKNTFLLGQNAPIEPDIKAEREFKRLRALELQAAIVKQLEDRERQKKEEREQRIREEREEDERFRRQQELERKRLDEERRMIEEKQKREQKRAEALRVALERAEQQAKLEKENKKNRRLRENLEALSLSRSENDNRFSESKEATRRSPVGGESNVIQNIYIEQTAASPRRGNQERAPESAVMVANPQMGRFSRQSDKKVETPRQSQTDTFNAIAHTSHVMNMMHDAPLSLVQIPIAQDVFTPINFANGGAVQMALLVPQTSVYPCMHQQLSMQALISLDAANQMKNSVQNSQNCQLPQQIDTDDCSTVRDRGAKLLTPSKYRNPNYRDASTQTDIETVSLKCIGIEEKAPKEKVENFETIIEQEIFDEKLNSSKKEKRINSEDRISGRDLENRPKWGVNKPPTQYKKQSEKDIFYTQKRKLRQRKRAQEKLYTSHSSDDNRSPSPDKNSNEKPRVSLSDYHWKKKAMNERDAPFGRNLSVETTQILPLECDQTGVIRVGESLTFQDGKKVIVEKKSSSSSKRGITLTQKFMNDKYGNPKMWDDNYSPLDAKHKYDEDTNIKEKLENRKKYMDTLNIAKRDQSNHYRDDESNQPIILDQLRSLRDSLKKQQQIWGKYDNVRRSPSPKNEVDLEME